MKHWYYSTGALFLLAILFLALTALNDRLLSGARLDLTENRLYTLSDGTRNLLRSLDEPVNLYFFFSEESSSELPVVRAFANRVEEMLTEMAGRAGNRLRVERLDPRPFSEAEDQAARFGLSAVPVGRTGDTLFMGIAGTNAVDGVEVIPFLQPDREELLEYELARLIYVLSRPEPPTVGLLSGLPMSGGFDPMTQQTSEPWVIHQQIEQMFEVESVATGASELPDGLDALVLIHPRDLSEDLKYAIDQFMLAGGRLLVFVDPHAEADPGADPSDPMAALSAERRSSLSPLFEAWGVEFDSVHVVGDLDQALQVSMQAGQPPVRHPTILGIGGEYMNRDDVITAELDTVNVSSAGYVQIADGASLVMEALLQSSPNGGLLSADQLRWAADPRMLAAELDGIDQSRTLAGRISGSVSSAFPERGEENEDHLAAGDIHAIVVADTDLLSDRFWVQHRQFFGSALLNEFADNGSFVINAIDNLMGNADLISVRSRATSVRPFTRVDRLRRAAEADLRVTEERLEQELAETEQRLTEIQQTRGDADLSVLTPEQEVEVDRFIARRLEIRGELRQVRRELDQEIRALGQRLKFINIGLMPLLLTAFALFLAWRRRQRQREG